MNILHINTNDLKGGAAKVMMRLLEAQNKMSHHSRALVGRKESINKHVYPFDIEIKEESEYEGCIDYNVFGAFNLYKNPLIQDVDVVHLHNLHGYYFHPFALSMLSHIKPVVWTLHDMQSVTGHCAHSYNCNKWLNGCGNCPYLNEYPAINKDRTSLNWLEKKEIYRQSKLFITPVSKWTGDIVSRSILNNHPMEVILNGVDVNIYRPLDKKTSRDKYGIPHNCIIIGTVANGGATDLDKKGGKYIKIVLERLVDAGYNILAINVGGSKEGYQEEYLLNTGHIATEQEMAEIFNTFDLFLFPSLAETFGLVIAEAMACGIPTVSFDSGGIPEVIKHEETGFIAPQKNVNQLYAYTEMLVKDEDLREKFSKASRSYCVAHFDHRVVTERYLDVYEKAVQNFRDSKSETLYFDLQIVPNIVSRQPEFINAEKLKGKGTIKSSFKKAPIAVITDGYEDISRADVIFIKRNHYSIDDNYFDTMLYKGISTDVISGDVMLRRKNEKPFFKKISPVIVTGGMIDTSIGSLFFSKCFFEENKQAILNGEIIKYQSIESFSVENISIFIDDFMKSKISDRVYIYGAGTHTIELLNESRYLRDLVVEIIDQNPVLIGKKLLDRYEIVALNSISEEIPILISSARYENEIFEQLSTTVTNPLIKIYNY